MINDRTENNLYEYHNRLTSLENDFLTVRSKQMLQQQDVTDEMIALAKLGLPAACAVYYDWVAQGKIPHEHPEIDTIVDGFGNEEIDQQWSKFRKMLVCDQAEIDIFHDLAEKFNHDVR
ncbi:MAG: hypothetical protein NC133_03175 [Prevotella sp.]|nr:hypothetical protein [Prevotella sp.]